ncbi:cytidine deaminase [Ilyomonas limi]|uniref:Cytidine deaminase n=1 Tax=Ilyomonas limi TaxID=2575867 RepID=A0A4U3L294_9BACT|nr:cytidine deaminase [Ilyomonas limi]TKK68972.1 cytidine deaminase [Ilyomonas limi]
MVIRDFGFQFEEYSSAAQLSGQDKLLLQKASEATKSAYAPYSQFLVGAAALLANNEIVTGSNQENASFPAGICAERALLASAAQLFPNVAVKVMAVTYHHLKGSSDTPVTPCGLCRQVMTEYELRMDMPMRLILSGTTGPVFVIPSIAMLLPLAFQLGVTE